MLSRLVAKGSSLASLWFGISLFGCGSAAPVDVGNDYPLYPLVEPDEGEGTMGTEKPVMSSAGELDFVNRAYERGEVSPLCKPSFEACGGVLAGTWQVEDTCYAEIRDRTLLQTWGEMSMDLDAMTCTTAVQRLTSSWSGLLTFDRAEATAIDERRRLQIVDIALTASCLGPTLGLDDLTTITPVMCKSLENSRTSCALAAGVCMCTNQTQSSGKVDGQYGPVGVEVAVGDGTSPAVYYEYCVDGDRLYWREDMSSSRHVILRRIVAPPPGTTDPMEVPR